VGNIVADTTAIIVPNADYTAVFWDARNKKGVLVAPGNYLARLTVNETGGSRSYNRRFIVGIKKK
jgi:hypothetical protein